MTLPMSVTLRVFTIDYRDRGFETHSERRCSSLFFCVGTAPLNALRFGYPQLNAALLTKVTNTGGKGCTLPGGVSCRNSKVNQLVFFKPNVMKIGPLERY
jgi:hypothetical protein